MLVLSEFSFLTRPASGIVHIYLEAVACSLSALLHKIHVLVSVCTKLPYRSWLELIFMSEKWGQGLDESVKIADKQTTKH